MKRLTVTLFSLLALLAVGVRGAVFHRLDTSQGLPSAQVNWMAQDSRGYLWFGTVSGLSRFDGYRFRNFFASTASAQSLPDDNVRRIFEAADGRLWVKTVSGWCVYDPVSERISRQLDERELADMERRANSRQLTDAAGNTWRYGDHRWQVTPAGTNAPTTDIGAFLRSAGLEGVPTAGMVLRDVAQTPDGQLWVATDHDGLFAIDWKQRRLHHYTADRTQPGALPDNTIQHLFVDRSGALWLGTLKNGAARLDNRPPRFPLVELGDVCTIAEDRQGRLWCGTNDAGIVCYDPATGQREHYGADRTRLGSDVVVSSLADSHGALWFGTYKGGLARMADGQWTVWRHADTGLPSDNVWALAELHDGRLAVGTLDAGLQLLDPQDGQWTPIGGVPNNYVASAFVCADGNVLIGHTQYYSAFDPTTRQLTHVAGTADGRQFANPTINQVVADSRGLVWLATPSGVNVYDPTTGQLELLNADNGLAGNVACSVVEDLSHRVWVVTANGLSAVTVSQKNNRWSLETLNYNQDDGLQERQFNFRSALLTRAGDLIVGGQDGINIVRARGDGTPKRRADVIFSGLMLADHTLAVGEAYEGRVVLKQALDETRRLVMAHDVGTFSLLLATSDVQYPARTLFAYRLLGQSDQWQRLNADVSQLTFSHLPSGSYRLQVQALDRDGQALSPVAELQIVVRPPFYRSPWAIALYVALLAALAYYASRRYMARQKEKFELEQMRREAEKDRQLDEMKLNFFTNVSHELRTPLALVISPLQKLVGEERDDAKRERLTLVYRNAQKLLGLVNQLLDMRKVEAGSEQLHLGTGDVVAFVRGAAEQFRQLQDKRIDLTFSSTAERLSMAFDDDKLGKMLNNLLSNAFKFTPEGGQVAVSVATQPAGADTPQTVAIAVADTGIGIGDDDKRHIFDRFYQVDNRVKQPFGGSGIGLSLVKEFATLHGGTVGVADNEGGGTVFTITLPVRQTQAIAAKAETPAAPTADKDQADAHAGDKPRLLLVDDSQDFLDFMADVLADHYEVETAHDGREALEAIGRRQPDIILSDVMMPVMDGNELCRAVRQNAQTAHIPFVMLTARMAQEHEIEGMESGADDYITKPFNLDLLHLRIAALTRRHETAQPTDSPAAQPSPKIDPHASEVAVTSLDRQFVQAATDYVERHIDNPDLTVEALSEALNMSRVHLYKRMLSLTGNTPSEFIRLIRLQRGEQLLRQSQLSVAEISYKVGFNNPRYFSKYFKEMYGMMPSQYKGNHGG